ncbi:MAG: outer membrane protein assembly factor BamB [Gammaproteobacteria bacterium]
MRLTLRCAVVLVSLVIGGCGTVGNFLAGKDNSAPPAALTKLESTVAVQTLWSKDVGSGSEEKYIKLPPVVAGDKVFTADRKGRVSAYGTASGQLLWETQTKAPISGGPGSGDGLVLVGTSEGEVIALNAGTGEIAWRSQVSSEILAPPHATQGVVVARTIDGKLFGLDAKQGTRIWVYEQSVPALTLRGTSAPLLVGDRVIAGFANSKLAAITLNEGKLLWEASVAEPRGRTELERLVDISGEMQVADGTIYVASFQGRVAAVDIESGRARWARNMSSNAGIGVGAGNLYVTDDQSHVWALDRRDGGTLWKQTKLQARSATAPAVIGNYVVVGDFEGYLHWMSQEDGSFVARIRIDDDGIIAAPVVVEDTLYVSGKGGVLAALRAGK